MGEREELPDREGLLWPLALFFVLALLGSLIWLGYRLYNDHANSIGWLWPISVVLSGILLYARRFWIAIHLPDFPSVSARITATQKAIDAATQRIAAIETAVSGLSTSLGAITAQLKARQEVDAKINEIAEQFGASGALRKSLDAIEAKVAKL